MMNNERIRELAVEANLITHKIPNGLAHLHTEKDLDQFAELIVRECTNVVEGGSFLHDQAPTAMFAKECSSAIKRHFGVKQ